MPATEPLYHLTGIKPSKLSKEEYRLLEAELYARVCEELKEYFRLQFKDFFHVMKINKEMENYMLEANFICHVINDILLTEEYSLSGIAYYTQTPEEVICDVVAGRNTAPSLPLSRRIMDLHRAVRPELYKAIMRKLIEAYLMERKEEKENADKK